VLGPVRPGYSMLLLIHPEDWVLRQVASGTLCGRVVAS